MRFGALVIGLFVLAPTALAEGSQSELLAMGGYHSLLRASAEDGPQDITYRGYSGRLVFTSSALAIEHKVPGRLGAYYENALFDHASYDDDPLVPDAMLAKTFGIEWALGVFDFPFQIDAAIGWAMARVNLGAVDKEVAYAGYNGRYGAQFTFGEHFVYFLRVERNAYALTATDGREEGEAVQPNISWQSTPVLLGFGYRN